MSERAAGGRTLPMIGTVILPGVCVVAAIAVVALSIYHGGNAQVAWGQTCGVLESVNTNWGVIFCLAAAAFLIGTVVRAIKVNMADDISGWVLNGRPGRWLLRRINDRFTDKLFETRFPYRPVMGLLLKDAQANGRAERVQLPQEGTEHAMFNLWKVELTDAKDRAMSLVDEIEGRVRLFASLFWAGLWGCLITLAGMAACWALRDTAAAAVQPVLLAQLAVCGLVLTIFGWRLRPVRGQEVAILFLAYIVFQEGKDTGVPKTAGGAVKVSSPGEPNELGALATVGTLLSEKNGTE